jgi:hypothetical protein
MLAAMSSLASLARATASAAPAFNSTFYATVATVIPVLFLALAIQGRMYEQLLRTALWFTRTKRAALPLRSLRDIHLSLVAAVRLIWLAIVTVNSLLWLIALLIPAAGFVGEAAAVIALYQGHDDSSTRLGVLVATLFLLLAVATGPMLTYIMTFLNTREQAGADDHATAKASGEPELQGAATHDASQATAPKPGTTSQPETDEAGTEGWFLPGI